jgi:hypothetical protein
MASSKHVDASTTAQTVTLTGGAFHRLVVVNVDGGSTAAVYYTYTSNATAPTVAVAEADDTYVAAAGWPAVSHLVTGTDIRVSVIAASGTPKVAVIAS